MTEGLVDTDNVYIHQFVTRLGNNLQLDGQPGHIPCHGVNALLMTIKRLQRVAIGLMNYQLTQGSEECPYLNVRIGHDEFEVQQAGSVIGISSLGGSRHF